MPWQYCLAWRAHTSSPSPLPCPFCRHYPPHLSHLTLRDRAHVLAARLRLPPCPPSQQTVSACLDRSSTTGLRLGSGTHAAMVTAPSVAPDTSGPARCTVPSFCAAFAVTPPSTGHFLNSTTRMHNPAPSNHEALAATKRMRMTAMLRARLVPVAAPGPTGCAGTL